MLRSACLLLCSAALVSPNAPPNRPTAESAATFASASIQASTVQADSTALLRLQCELGRAIVKKDRATFERMAATDYTVTTPEGDTMNRSQELQSLESGFMHITAFTMSDLRVRSYENAAVVTGRTHLEGMVAGQDVTGTYQFTDTWIRRNQQWQGVASQLTALAKQPTTPAPDQCAGK